MQIGRTQNPERTKVVVVSADAEFQNAARMTFGASRAIELVMIAGSLAGRSATLDVSDASVIVIDIETDRADDMNALVDLSVRLDGWPPVIAVTKSFDEAVARTLMQMRIADFLVKPVKPVDLVRACARVAKARPDTGAPTEAQIYTFLPAVGGAGVTTLAIQTAMTLLTSSSGRAKPSVCMVDLDFQHGTVADYLDLEPRLNLAEIEPRPDRLDRQLLEIMLSYHASGLAVVAAPNRPAEMRSFDPAVVTRLLDLVSSHFQYVVFDMPRTWFSWTDSVLLGSNHVFIVSETTVPALRHAKQLVAAIKERLGDGPKPRVIVNRFEQKMFAAGLRHSDLDQTLGEAFAGAVPNDYALVREAIDRGVPLDEVKPGNKVSAQLRKLVVAGLPPKPEPKPAPLMKKLKLAVARS